MARFVKEELADRGGWPLLILDIGSMDVNGTFRQFFDDPAWTYTGVDMESGPGVDTVLPQPYDWSLLENNRYDVVISGQAFEHIEVRWVTILEVARVMRPNGLRKRPADRLTATKSNILRRVSRFQANRRQTAKAN